MKKLLSLVSALVCAISLSAVEVTFNFTTAEGLAALKITANASTAEQGAGTEFTSATLDGITISAAKGTASTAPRIWMPKASTSTDLRIYKGSTLTITGNADADLITSIQMTGSSLKFNELTNGQWTGSQKSVSFTVIESEKSSFISTITVTMNQESVEYKPDTLTVSQAINLIKTNASLAAKPHYIKGLVAGDPFTLGSNGPAFFMTDYVNHSDSLEAFKINKDASTKYKDAEEMSKDIAMGDTILIFADGLSKYNDIFETTGGYFVKTLGKSSAIVLNWVAGSAYLQADGWALEIAEKQNDTKNLVEFSIKSSKKDGIAGSYPFASGAQLTKNGAKSAITSGSLVLKFKEIGTNGYNVYAAQVTFAIGEAIYRIKNDVEFYAVDENSDEIVLVGDRPFKPTEGQEITCAQAREYALSLASGTTGDVKVTVVGYVTDLFSNGVTFWMDDQQGSAKTFQAYMVKTVQPAGVGLKNGAKVKVTGYVTNFSGTTPELKNGAVEIVEGGEQIVATEVTVADALAAAKALEQNKTSEGVYAITGYISAIAEEFKADKGNMSFWMSDNLNDAAQEFQAFRVSCTEDLAAKLRPGAKVKVTAKITHFYQSEKPAEGDQPAKPERTIYETVQGGTVELLAVSGVEDVMSNAPAVKFIENGQIYILRNGVRYNLQGQVAE